MSEKTEELNSREMEQVQGGAQAGAHLVPCPPSRGALTNTKEMAKTLGHYMKIADDALDAVIRTNLDSK